MNISYSTVALFLLLFCIADQAPVGSVRLDKPHDHELSRVNLSSITYEELHRFAVKDQVEHQLPAQKSLHTRLTISLNGIYDFCFDEATEGFTNEWYSQDIKSKCQPANFYRLPVPAAFNDIVSNQTAHDYVGWSWYQKRVDMSPLSLQSSRQGVNNQWFLQFANVNYLAIVWVQRIDRGLDGTEPSPVRLLGSHVGGHLPFVFNLTDLFVEAGDYEDGLSFRMTVAVSNVLTDETIPSGRVRDLSRETGQAHYRILEPDFDFFFYAGIMGNVDLFALRPNHISQVDISSSPLGSYLMLNLKICVNAQYVHGRSELKLRALGHPESEGLFPTLDISTSGGRICRSVSATWIDDVSVERILVTRIILMSIKRSAFGTKQRVIHDEYELRVNMDNGYTLDQHKLRHQLQGFGMHMEQMFSGRHMSQAAILKDIYLVKQMGANIIRTSHYPYSDEFLDACDEHGIMVIGECAAVGLKSFSKDKLTLHKQLLLEMTRRDHHHPSVVAWSVANEPESQLPAARAYFAELLEFARTNLSSYVAGRPLTAAIAQSHAADTIGDLLDVVMVNRYYGWYDYTGAYQLIRPKLLESLRGWAARLPGKPLVVSEFGADTLAGLHSWTKTIYSEEFQSELLAQHELLFDELWHNRSQTATLANSTAINFLGSLVWNFADFSTAQQSLMRVGGRNRKGLFTIDREPKQAALLIRQVYQRRRLEAEPPGAVGEPRVLSRTHARSPSSAPKELQAAKLS